MHIAQLSVYQLRAAHPNGQNVVRAAVIRVITPVILSAGPRRYAESSVEIRAAGKAPRLRQPALHAALIELVESGIKAAGIIITPENHCEPCERFHPEQLVASSESF